MCQRKPGRCLWLMLLFLLLLCISIYAQEPVDTVPELLGRDLYNRACATCHGMDGKGNGPSARYLNPRPRDFTSGTFKFRSTPSGQLPTDQDLFRTIAQGIPRTMMPAWEDLLTVEQRHNLVEYIKLFSDKFQKYRPGQAITIPAEPPVTQQSIQEGKYMYMVMECWACHGPKGKGNGKSANTLKDEWGHKIKPFDFSTGTYKGGRSDQAVFRTFDTGLNGTPMPSYADAFLFGGDSIGDVSSYRQAYSESEVKALKSYLESQPTEKQLSSMSEDEVQKLTTRRKWALVHYVKSLTEQPGVFHWLFVEDTETTKSR